VSGRLLRVLALAVATMAPAACGGDSEDPARDELERYLRQAEPALSPLFVGVAPVADFLQGRTDSAEPRTKAALRADAAVMGYREARRRMARLEPPSELRDEHLALVESFDDVAAAYERMAEALRAGPAAIEELDTDAMPGLEEAGPTFQRWEDECARVADEADVDTPDWFEELRDQRAAAP
jgi:hypothetical protein